MKLDIMIPVSLDLDWPTREEIVASIIEQNEKYGFKKFLLAAPGVGWRSKPYPDTRVFERFALLYREVADELSGRDITLGWWDTLTVKSGSHEDLQPIVKADGTDHPFANCPIDEKFRMRFAKNVAAFARIAKPSVIYFEDDYSINAAAGGYGCFCPLHLSEFARREGRTYTREQLLSIFGERDTESLAIQRRYRELMRDSLVGLSEAIRRELDLKSPEIPIGLNQAGSSDLDGNMTAAVCSALAGKRHIPESRIYGAFYCGGELKGIPKRLYHAIYSREHIEGEFKFYHESDTFPHTRFFSSAKQMKAFMAIAYSSGFIGSLFQTQQLLDDPNEENAYGEMFLSERDRFNALATDVALCERRGVSLPYDPFYNTIDGLMRDSDPYWCRVLDMFGIPYTTREAGVTFIDSRQARYSTDDEIIRYLSGGVFLDGDAAHELCRRGFGKYIGVEVGGDVAEGKTVYDLGAREVISPPFDSLSKGKNMPIAHMFCSGGNGILRKLTPIDESVEVISRAYTFDKKCLTVAMTRFENELSGRVVVMGMTVRGNLSQSLFNYRRKRLFEEMLLWCSEDIPFVRREPAVHMIYNRPREDADFDAILTLINLGDDTLASLELYLPESLRMRDILSLDRDGRWKELSYTRSDDGITVNAPLELCEPLYLKFK